MRILSTAVAVALAVSPLSHAAAQSGSPAPRLVDSAAARAGAEPSQTPAMPCALWMLRTALDARDSARTAMPRLVPDTTGFRTPVLRPDLSRYRMPSSSAGSGRPAPSGWPDSLIWRRPGVPDTVIACPHPR